MNRLNYIRKEYSIEQIAYFAGIIDGEGSLYIGNFSKNPKTGKPYYQTCMQVTNTDEPLIDWLVTVFGGLKNIRTKKQHSFNSRKQAYVWTATGDRLTHLCELILPYLICKKRQCEILLEMRSTYRQSYGGKGIQGTPEMPDSIREKRQSLMDEIRSLHIRTFSHKNSN